MGGRAAAMMAAALALLILILSSGPVAAAPNLPSTPLYIVGFVTGPDGHSLSGANVSVVSGGHLYYAKSVWNGEYFLNGVAIPLDGASLLFAVTDSGYVQQNLTVYPIVEDHGCYVYTATPCTWQNFSLATPSAPVSTPSEWWDGAQGGVVLVAVFLVGVVAVVAYVARRHP
jgi:hypothetical protein